MVTVLHRHGAREDTGAARAAAFKKQERLQRVAVELGAEHRRVVSQCDAIAERR